MMITKFDVQVPETSVTVPRRRMLWMLTLAFAALIAILNSWVVSRIVHVAVTGQVRGFGLGLSGLLLIGSAALLGACLAAVFVFQKLLLPLETLQAQNEEHSLRIEELESESASATVDRVMDNEYQKASDTAKQAVAGLEQQVQRLQQEVTRLRKQLEHRPPSIVGETAAGGARDPLTGVAFGSVHFEQRVSELAEVSRRSGVFHGLLLIGIDHFGKVHDQFGPAAGEENVWQIAQNILEHTPADGEAFRLSSKHFAMLLPERSDSASYELAQRLCTDISGREFAWKGQPLPSSLSIGVVSIGLADHSEDEISERAFHALGQAQQLGGARVHKESLLPMIERRAREKSLGEWLKEKLKSNQLRLAAQPIMPAVPNPATPSWVELLLRIEDDDGVWLTPEHYVDVLERMQLTSLIDKWVIETALKPGPRCANLTGTRGLLSINIFGSSLLRDSFLVQLRDVLARSALPTQQIVFELDESFVVQHSSRVAAFVGATAEFGCQLALDRYRGGVGLSALRHFPAQYIKLHESLVQRQTTDLIDRAHIDWLVTSAHLSGAKVVASAVRDEETLKRLRQSGVDFVQGFAISAPSPYAL